MTESVEPAEAVESVAPLGATERELFGRFADQVIPAAPGFPAPSEIGVHADGLDRLARVRPALATQLAAALATAAAEGIADIMAARAERPELFEPVAAGAAGIYLTERRIMDAYGYPGRPELNVGDPYERIPEYESLTAPVRRLGFIWNATPEV